MFSKSWTISSPKPNFFTNQKFLVLLKGVYITVPIHYIGYKA